MKIVDGKNYLSDVRELIEEYTKWLGRDLSFQNLDQELADIAAKYLAPEGEILVLIDEGIVQGMVAYHRLSDTRCEIKRLYVRPTYRGHHAGERLLEEILGHAKKAGYQEAVLDTIEPLKAAIHLYHKIGFAECAPYYDNPMDDVIYMAKTL
ncbi:GNAT family N-acetyltransferase [Limosilactobacillus gastricus]|uniref:GNAT family N-acetyltransferase n=1 Tax=Limosilactobacillus gastricus TaxID=227942 RepID=UPI0026F3740B|nr:GNAT family N-acetyltransferase [Limosilactobacillus gastricus]